MTNFLELHPAVTQGFEKNSEDYELGRPGYNQDIVTHLSRVFGLSGDSQIVDLGAGTGKLTRELVSTEARVIGMEPVEGMRRKFKKMVSNIEVVGGVAEAMPLSDSSVDLVTVGQAFHWFQSKPALEEIHRVLKIGGGLSLIWNVRDSTIPWVSEVNKLIDQYELEGTVPRHRSGKWKAAFEENSNLFTPLESAQFHSIQKGTEDLMLKRFTSISYIAALPNEKRREFESKVRGVIRSDPLSGGKEIIELPYKVDVYWCFKV